MGVTAFVTWVKNSSTDYLGKDDFHTSSQPMYPDLEIVSTCDKEQFIHYLKIHQQGETDYLTFCKHCAETGIEKWKVSLDAMICTYFDIAGTEVLIEKIPG